MDYNRAGVPLLEIVSEPDMRTGAEAAAYGAELRRIMRFLDVSGGAWGDGGGVGMEAQRRGGVGREAQRGVEEQVGLDSTGRAYLECCTASVSPVHAHTRCPPTGPPSTDGNMAEGSMRCDVNISVRSMAALDGRCNALPLAGPMPRPMGEC